MVNRIFAFIESQQLTPTEFADKIGVSRASISSIKTGRTQPTLSLVEKIKQHFSDVDVNWLIFGEGEAPSKIESNNTESDLLFDKLDNVENDTPAPSVANDYQAVYIASSPKTEENELEQSNITPPTINLNKSIKKVILLYDDGSFEEFSK